MASDKGSVRRRGLTVEYDREHCYTEVGKCAVLVWRGEVLKTQMPVMRARWESLAERKGSFAIVVVVLASAPPPSIERRQEIKVIYMDLEEQLQAVASIFEGQGLKGSTASLVMSTMLLLAKSPYPTKNTTSVKVATDWLEDVVSDVSASKLREGIETAMRIYREVCQREFKENLVPTRQEILRRAAAS